MLSFKKRGFTLAEVMIVLTVIGILTAILMPTAFNSAPKEDIVKFKKAHANLYKVIKELSSSEQYYSIGNLRKKPNGTAVTDTTYFCQSVADLLRVRSVSCTAYGNASSYLDARGTGNYLDISKIKTTANTNVDAKCAKIQKDTLKADVQIVTTDGVVWFEESSNSPFGSAATTADALGDDALYKIFCIDVDGYAGAEAPFGYAIRSDGAIQTGARADQWIAKKPQE